MTPYYTDDAVTLHAGDCLDVLRDMPAASVDAVVTDPPYGLEFMGKEWDRLGDIGQGSHAGFTDGTGFKGFRLPTGYNASTNLKCQTCGKWRYDHVGRKCECGPDAVWPNVKAHQGRAMQDWHFAWATECLRVLRPGGHMLAFGGTRTYHRLACAVEDAGFEIRDSITWLYGSGFPKSLDVGKAIDKAAGVEREVVGDKMRPDGKTVMSARNPVRWTNAEGWDRPWRSDPDRIAATGQLTAPATDDAKRWQGWGTALKPAWENIVVATKPHGAAGILAAIGSYLDRLEAECSSLVNGAGPSSRPTQAGEPEVRTDSAPANAATPPEVEPARITRTGQADASSVAMATSASELAGVTCWNIVTSWRQCWAELCDLTNTSTTGTTSSTTTDLKTLWSCLAQITVTNISPDPTSPGGLSSLADAVDNLFAAALLNSRATLALTAAASATGSTPPTSQGEAVQRRPSHEPIVVARKPLIGTVSANVLAHGTGGLNIDACRVGMMTAAEVARSGKSTPGMFGLGPVDWAGDNREPAGRWPSNVVLSHTPDCEQVGTRRVRTSTGVRGGGGAADWNPTDRTQSPGQSIRGDGRLVGYADADGLETVAAFACTPGCPVAELDRQSGVLHSQDPATRLSRSQRQGVTEMGTGQSVEYGDTGGASRFFPTFRYEAKAPGHERPRDGETSHPTTKPLDLMRWLLRLVVPPGGTCLDPFAGSGTTGEACVIEGFRCILIEREPTYLPLIVARLSKPIQPDMFGGET